MTEQMEVTEQVELNGVNFTNVVIVNNKNFELLTAATFLLQHIIFYHYLKKLVVDTFWLVVGSGGWW